jgi:hypothetical protein
MWQLGSAILATSLASLKEILQSRKKVASPLQRGSQ